MAKKKAIDGIMQARVLGGFVLDGVQYNPDEIIEADGEMIEQLGSSVDADPAAVEYCLGLKNPVVRVYGSRDSALQESEQDQAAY